MKRVSISLSKLIFLLALIAIFLNPIKSHEDDSDNEGTNGENENNAETAPADESGEHFRICKRELLFSYGVENPGYIRAPGMLCKHRVNGSCCSRTAESQLLEKWMLEDRIKISQNIFGYIHVLEGIFDYYEDIIIFAKYIHMNPISDEKCLEASRELIMNYLRKSEIKNIMKKIREAGRFLLESRKGFYCTLCDVEMQQYFDPAARKLVLSTHFCENLVEKTVEATYLRATHILPILQNINTILLCDKDKEFEDDEQSEAKEVIQNVQYGLDEDDFEEMMHCYNVFKEFDKPELYLSKCESYCKDYKFSLASRVFEGSLSKISFLYDKILKKKFDMTDPVFSKKDEERSFVSEDGIEMNFYLREEFDFTQVPNVYFNSKYSAQNLQSYETVYEEFGINPVDKANKSKFLFGHTHFLEDLPANKFANKKILSVTLFGILLMSLFVNKI